MPDLIRHPPSSRCKKGRPRLKPVLSDAAGGVEGAGVTSHFLAGGATYGLKAPPGTADATGLANPFEATDATPNTQSSTRMCGRTTLHSAVHALAGTLLESSQLFASVLRQRTS
jgi:hypothetical protein